MTHELTLETSTDSLRFDRATGVLTSLRRRAEPDRNLLTCVDCLPALALQYLDGERQYRYVDSLSAAETEAQQGDGQVAFTYRSVGGLGVDVTLTVNASPQEPFSRWRVSVRNHGGVRIVDVQFPFLVLPVGEHARVVSPEGLGGRLIARDGLPLDCPELWQIRPENGDGSHYPGGMYAQFLAWHDDRAGVYLACEDAEGNVKLIKAARRGDGVRLGFAHVGDWPAPGERTLEYDVVLRTFDGDWYDAAGIYRGWTLAQKWATPLARRTDVPDWLLESPPHITVRLQGYLDDGPTPAVEEFVPYEKCVPLLDGIASRVEAPLVAVLMSWERAGPWVYPDCFPPVGGDESLSRFVALARERGWRVGSFCNGTRWVVGHTCNGYDGRGYYDEHGGAASVCRRHDGEPWVEGWDAGWRPSYACCMAQGLTRETATGFVRRLIGWGMRSIQFFDQNCNAVTFPCFADDHGHPPMPGKWMTRAMEDTIGAFRRVAEEAGADDAIQSTENPCNEVCLPLFQQSDVRISPPSSGYRDYIPLYHYLFHECTIMHGMMSTGPEPHSLPIRTAWLGVWGEIPGAVITGDGTLLNRDTFNWAPWEPKVGNNDHALEMIRVVTAMRRGHGRDFLVYGRMLRPASVECDTVAWETDGRSHAVPALAHAAWQAPDGRTAMALANWTAEERRVAVSDARLGDGVTMHVCARESASLQCDTQRGRLEVTLPALSCAIVL